MSDYNMVDTYNANPNANCITNQMVALHAAWRSLWEQHVAWTRMTIISAVNGLADLTATSTRLLQNAPDMGQMLRPYYGDAIAAGFSKLISSHLQIALDLVLAAKKGDTAAAAAAEKKWYANADDIAAFLAGINPYWQLKALQDMLYQHLAMTKGEAVAMLSGDYPKSIALYNEIEKQALEMADAISGGIMMQFPWLFR